MKRPLALTILIILVSFTFISVSAVSAQENEYLQVKWHDKTSSDSFNRTWYEANFIFGPLPKVQITLPEGSPLPDDGTGVISLNEPVNITIIVPKAGIRSGTIGTACIVFSGWIDYITAQLELSYDSQKGFTAKSWKYATFEYQGGLDLSPFFELDQDESRIVSTDEKYYITFIGVFNSSTISARYQIRWEVYDTDNVGYESAGYSLLQGQQYTTYIIGEIANVDFETTTHSGQLIPEHMIRWGEEVWLRILSDKNLEKIELKIDIFKSIDVENQTLPVYIYMIYNSSGVYMAEGYEYWVSQPSNSYLKRVFFDNYTYFTPTGNDTSNPQDIIFKAVFNPTLSAGQYEVKLYIKPEGNIVAYLPSNFDSHIYVETVKATVLFTDFDDNPVWGIGRLEELYITFKFTGPTEYIENITAFTFALSRSVNDKIHQTYNFTNIYITYGLLNESFYISAINKAYAYNWILIDSSTFTPVTEGPFAWSHDEQVDNISSLDCLFELVFSDEVPEGEYWPGLSFYNTADPQLQPPPHFPGNWYVITDYNPITVDFIIGVTLLYDPGENLYPFRVTSEGALDLDGDLSTGWDRYYVLSEYVSIDSWSYNSTGVEVLINWIKGNTSISDIRFALGLITFANQFDWLQSYYWYHTDWTPLNEFEMTDVKNIIDNTWGYELLKFATSNVTLADFIGSLWWLDDNKWEYSWFYFTVDENYLYQTSSITDTVQFKADYSALLLFNDTDGDGVPRVGYQSNTLDSGEVTHYFLIDSVEEIVFQRPFNSTQQAGSQNITLDTPVDFEVFLNNVTGSLYPVKLASDVLYSPYTFYHNPNLTLDTMDFEKSVESSTITQIKFAGHFQVTTSEDNSTSASLKVDQYIGDWSLKHFNNSVLLNRSLAISYNTYLTTTTAQTKFNAGETPLDDSNTNSTASDEFSFTTQQAKLAEIRMGGLNYTWGKNNISYSAPASTTPLYTFESMYTTPTGDSLTSFEIQSSMFFLTTGFKNWDGYSIYNDPQFSIFPVLEEGGQGDLLGSEMTVLIIASVIVIAVLSIALFLIRRNRKII